MRLAPSASNLRLLACVLFLLPALARAQDAGTDAALPVAVDASVAADATTSQVDAGAPASLPETAAPDAEAPVPSPVVVPAPSAEPDSSAPAPVAIAAEAKSAPAEAPALPVNPPAATEVTVVGTRLSRTAGSAHILRGKDLERFNYDDPHRVLTSVPGVYVRGEDGFGLRPNIGIRGVDPDRSKKVTLLEDGVLFGPAPYSAPAAYFFPIMTRMEKVRVIKGPGTISYGPQTVGGTIDLVTRDIPSELSGSADIAAGQYGYGKAHVYGGGSTERFGFLIEGVRLQNNGFKELPSGADTGFVRNEWMVKGSYNIDPSARVQNELKLKLSYSDEVSNESYLGLTGADFKRNPDLRYAASALDRMVNHRTSIVLTHKAELAKHWNVVTNLYRHDFHRTWRKVNDFERVNDFDEKNIFDVLASPGGTNASYYDALRGEDSSNNETILIGPNQRDFVSTGAETRFFWQRERGVLSHRLEIGGRYHYDKIDRRHSQEGFLVQDGELVSDGRGSEVMAFGTDATHAVALHALYALTWSGLTITPGLRTEIIRARASNYIASTTSRDTTAVLLPGAGAYYSILPDFGVLAGVYQGFSAPAAGSGAKPEKSINYEGGLRYMRGPMRVEGIGFFNDYQNMTSICGQASGCPQAMVDKQYDLGRARIYGVEVLAQHDLPVGKLMLPLLLSYTFSRSEFVNSFVSSNPVYRDVTAGDEVPFIPQHQLRASAGVEHRVAGANVSLLYASATREWPGTGEPPPELRMDEQVVVDVAASAKVWRTISFYLNVQNVFDNRYVASHRPFGARPNSPRWVQIGLKGSY